MATSIQEEFAAVCQDMGPKSHFQWTSFVKIPKGDITKRKIFQFSKTESFSHQTV
jgi:hypothetical protein